jgi:hypothetical protein
LEPRIPAYFVVSKNKTNNIKTKIPFGPIETIAVEYKLGWFVGFPLLSSNSL